MAAHPKYDEYDAETRGTVDQVFEMSVDKGAWKASDGTVNKNGVKQTKLFGLVIVETFKNKKVAVKRRTFECDRVVTYTPGELEMSTKVRDYGQCTLAISLPYSKVVSRKTIAAASAMEQGKLGGDVETADDVDADNIDNTPGIMGAWLHMYAAGGEDGFMSDATLEVLSLFPLVDEGDFTKNDPALDHVVSANPELWKPENVGQHRGHHEDEGGEGGGGDMTSIVLFDWASQRFVVFRFADSETAGDMFKALGDAYAMAKPAAAVLKSGKLHLSTSPGEEGEASLLEKAASRLEVMSPNSGERIRKAAEATRSPGQGKKPYWSQMLGIEKSIEVLEVAAVSKALRKGGDKRFLLAILDSVGEYLDEADTAQESRISVSPDDLEAFNSLRFLRWVRDGCVGQYPVEAELSSDDLFRLFTLTRRAKLPDEVRVLVSTSPIEGCSSSSQSLCDHVTFDIKPPPPGQQLDAVLEGSLEYSFATDGGGAKKGQLTHFKADKVELDLKLSPLCNLCETQQRVGVEEVGLEAALHFPNGTVTGLKYSVPIEYQACANQAAQFGEYLAGETPFPEGLAVVVTPSAGEFPEEGGVAREPLLNLTATNAFGDRPFLHVVVKPRKEWQLCVDRWGDLPNTVFVTYDLGSGDPVEDPLVPSEFCVDREDLKLEDSVGLSRSLGVALCQKLGARYVMFRDCSMHKFEYMPLGSSGREYVAPVTMARVFDVLKVAMQDANGNPHCALAGMSPGPVKAETARESTSAAVADNSSASSSGGPSSEGEVEDEEEEEEEDGGEDGWVPRAGDYTVKAVVMVDVRLLEANGVNYNPLFKAGEDVLLAGQLAELGVPVRKVHALRWRKDKMTSGSQLDVPGIWRHSALLFAQTGKGRVEGGKVKKFVFVNGDGKKFRQQAGGRYKWEDAAALAVDASAGVTEDAAAEGGVTEDAAAAGVTEDAANDGQSSSSSSSTPPPPHHATPPRNTSQ